jgi:TPR repeat protein
MTNLGGMYEDGLGLEKSMSKAQFWYDKAKEVEEAC